VFLWVLGTTLGRLTTIVMDGLRVALPTLAGGPLIHYPEAQFISDDGRVVAGNSTKVSNSESVAVGWRCS